MLRIFVIAFTLFTSSAFGADLFEMKPDALMGTDLKAVVFTDEPCDKSVLEQAKIGLPATDEFLKPMRKLRIVGGSEPKACWMEDPDGDFLFVTEEAYGFIFKDQVKKPTKI